MSPPNIFDYATSELSQDAVLAWLLAWADPSHAETDRCLHATGRRFIAALASAAGVPAPSGPVKIRRQYRGVDVVAFVGNDTLIAIEDKVRSRQHSNQLERYRKILEKEHADQTQIIVYLKTIEQASYEAVLAAKWTLFHRANLLEVIRPARDETDNAILRDYIDYLEGTEARTKSFLTEPAGAWNDDAWRGFFVALQDAVPGSWGYVSNAAGGFMGYWWKFLPVDLGELYLQLQQRPKQPPELVVKFSVGEGATGTQVRARWLEPVLQGMASAGFEQPSHLRTGKTMTLAQRRGDYRAFTDGRLDLGATIAVLQQAERALEGLIPR